MPTVECEPGVSGHDPPASEGGHSALQGRALCATCKSEGGLIGSTLDGEQEHSQPPPASVHEQHPSTKTIALTSQAPVCLFTADNGHDETTTNDLPLSKEVSVSYPCQPVPQQPQSTSTFGRWRARNAKLRHTVGHFLENRRTHQVLLVLITIDACFVLTELFYVVLHPTCPPSSKDELPHWLEGLAHAALAIDCLFVLEIPLALYAFGPRYYGLSWRQRAVPHAFLHLFDAAVILGTVILETVLRGKEQELAGLLVVLRLWRVVKVVEGVAVGVSTWDETKADEFKDAKKRVAELEAENKGLRRRLGAAAQV